MKTIYAKDYGIIGEINCTKEIQHLFEDLKQNSEPIKVVFEKCKYIIDASILTPIEMFVTNTIGDNQWKKGEIPHENRAILPLINLTDVEIDGNGCEFIANGQTTNVFIQNCFNLTLKNVNFDALNPDMHELTVLKKNLFSIDFKLDNNSRYIKDKNKFFFVGKDYKNSFFDSRNNAHWIGLIKESNLDALTRVSHPFLGALKVKEIEDQVFRAYYPLTFRFNLKDKFYIFDVRRKYNGIVIDNSSNISVFNIEQNFNYGLSIVCQNSEDISFDNLRLIPKKNVRLLASVADFIQVCMCRGKVSIKNSSFVGAGDDALNVHGIHFKIEEIKGNELTVAFKHSQSHGFNPFKSRDIITIVNPHSLLCKNTSEVISSTMIDEHKIKLTLDSTKYAVIGEVVENITANPDVIFENNFINRIITRGLLISVRGKVLIKNNIFKNTSMNSIAIANDAKNWYESGCVKDVTITDNEFLECKQKTLLIKPECTNYKGAVHSGIKFINNKVSNPIFYIKYTDGVVFEKNTYKRKPMFLIKKAEVKSDAE